jgi:UPF0176 protein
MHAAPILNLSAYAFTVLQDLPGLRQKLEDGALANGLKGTVLLAEEGINLFVAGPTDGTRTWLAMLRTQPGLQALSDGAIKWSTSPAIPFKRLKVKIKREIIRMNAAQLRPAQGRAPALDAATLARWLDAGRDDQGREIVMLDTRNGFELDHGAFADAINWKLSKFSDFPAALQSHGAALQGRTVVTYCTGGIRCEKAALAMRDAGIEDVWQLDGGILRYLETVGQRHWHGRCFVFDERESLGADLAPAVTAHAEGVRG